MASNEGHIHWSGLPSETVNYLGQELQMTSERTNMAQTVKEDPIGAIRIRLLGHANPGLLIPTMGWQAIPGTTPVLEARSDSHYEVGYIRVRQA